MPIIFQSIVHCEIVETDLRFAIDRRYIAMQLLKVVIYYLLGLLVVLCFLKPKDPVGFFIASFSACVIVYFGLNFPRAILLNNETIAFRDSPIHKKHIVRICDIINVRIAAGFYNSVIINTTNDKSYVLHPKDCQTFVKALKNYDIVRIDICPCGCQVLEQRHNSMNSRFVHKL